MGLFRHANRQPRPKPFRLVVPLILPLGPCALLVSDTRARRRRIGLLPIVSILALDRLVEIVEEVEIVRLIGRAERPFPPVPTAPAAALRESARRLPLHRAPPAFEQADPLDSRRFLS